MAFTQTRNDIIKSALRKLGVLAIGDSPSNEMVEKAAEALHGIINELQTEGTYLWKYQENTSNLTASSEVVGTDSVNYRCIEGHTSASADKPITGANYSSKWYSDGSSGSVWATATAYTSINEITLGSSIIDIDKMFVRRTNNDTPIKIISYEEYSKLMNKFITGTPEYAYIDHGTSISSGLTALTVRLYPHPDTTSMVIHHRDISNITESEVDGTALDVVKRWYRTLIFLLAYDLSFDFRVNPEVREALRREAKRLKTKQLQVYDENVSDHRIQPLF